MEDEMSITFRIATAADEINGPVAIITARQFAAFRDYLRVEGLRSGIVLLAPDSADDDYLSYHFEARICPLALASVARVFGYDVDVITVVEEAQFRGRRISVYRDEGAGTIAMRVSLTSDLGLELNLANGNAQALLESLGLRPDSFGEIPIASIRDRLANPAIQRRVGTEGMSDYVARLDRLLASAEADDSARLEWA